MTRETLADEIRTQFPSIDVDVTYKGIFLDRLWRLNTADRDRLDAWIVPLGFWSQGSTAMLRIKEGVEI